MRATLEALTAVVVLARLVGGCVGSDNEADSSASTTEGSCHNVPSSGGAYHPEALACDMLLDSASCDAQSLDDGACRWFASQRFEGTVCDGSCPAAVSSGVCVPIIPIEEGDRSACGCIECTAGAPKP